MKPVALPGSLVAVISLAPDLAALAARPRGAVSAFLQAVTQVWELKAETPVQMKWDPSHNAGLGGRNVLEHSVEGQE